MRLLIISDVHGNLEALEAVLAAAPDCDGVANLGDNVGYGACPNEVVERVRTLGDIFVRGNHDRACSGLSDLSDFNPTAALAARWTQLALTDENRRWVAELPRGPVTDATWTGIQFVHGSPFDEDEYLLSEPIVERLLETSPVPVTFFGHTHVQIGWELRHGEISDFRLDRGHRDEPQQMKVTLDAEARYFINPGSVGQPRDGDPRAGFATYDSAERSMTLYRVPYQLEQAQQRIIHAGLPVRLASRLAEGR